MSNDTFKHSHSSKKKHAGFYPRVLAHNIDLIILLPFFYLISYFVPSNGILFTLCGVLYIVYQTILETSLWQGSLGKKLQKIRVESDSDEKAPSLKQAFLRNTFKLISTIPFFGGFIWIAFDPKNRGLHDRIVGTVVVFVEN